MSLFPEYYAREVRHKLDLSGSIDVFVSSLRTLFLCGVTRTISKSAVPAEKSKPKPLAEFSLRTRAPRYIFCTSGLLFGSSELPSRAIHPVSSTNRLDIVDNDFLAFCSTSSMLTWRRFSSLSASNTLSTNIGINLAGTSSIKRAWDWP